jgi:hypothetical protein
LVAPEHAEVGFVACHTRTGANVLQFGWRHQIGIVDPRTPSDEITALRHGVLRGANLSRHLRASPPE